MFTKILKIIFLIFSVSKVNSIEKFKYVSHSYIDDNNVYAIQNYCSKINEKCMKVIKIDLRDNSKFIKNYHNLDINNDEDKVLIKQDFKKINLNKFIDIL